MGHRQSKRKGNAVQLTNSQRETTEGAEMYAPRPLVQNHCQMVERF